MEINKMLTLSTGHLTEETCNEYLDQVAYDKAECGAFLNVEYGPFDEPADLTACRDFARKHGCTWIMFDSDGPFEEGLTTYDW